MSEIKPWTIKPGTIVVDNNQQNYNTMFRAWGIILPKDWFIQYFQSEKGTWPTGNDYSHEVIKRYGNALPVVAGTNVTNSSAILNNVGPSDIFMSDSRYIGVKWFGKLHSNLFDRPLSFEVMRIDQNPAGLRYYPVTDLDKIVESRNRTYHNFDIGNSELYYDTITKDLRIANKYFTGKYEDKTLAGINRHDPNAAGLVKMLRECFPE
ncbi:MAG: hypothetical protein ACP5NW_05660 [Candidatus Woesearchaeota archaeon]